MSLFFLTKIFIQKEEMGKKKKIYEDENGKKYILKNGKKEYVLIIDSCIDFFEDVEAEEKYFEQLSKDFERLNKS